MADKCSGCMSKFKFREKPSDCPKCRRTFCNMCLDPKKVKSEGATCVYCSAKQRKLNQAEDQDVLKNFHDRYYKHKNQGPPIVSKLQNDPRIISAANAQTISSRPLVPDREVEALEERFRKLKEDRLQKSVSVPDESTIQKRLDNLREKPSDPVSEGQLYDRLNKLQGQPSTLQPTSCGGDGADPTKPKTETEQTNDLINQFSEEVAIDNKVSGVEPATLGDDPTHIITTPGTSQSKDEDPYKLLQDLHSFQAEQERDALKEVQGPDIQALLQQTRDKPDSTDITDITYPSIEDISSLHADANKPSNEVLQLISQATAENKLEEEERTRDEEYIKMSSKRLAHIKDEPDSDDEVKCKPKGKQSRDGLDFMWHHYNEPAGSAMGGAVGGAMGGAMVGNQWSFDDDENFDDEVHKLIQQMAEENVLDEKLERHGIGLEEPQMPSTSRSDTGAVNPYSYSAFGQEQLPWCCICNNNAELRCHDCDDDLYCVPCFSRGHEEYGWFDHKYVAYETPKN